MLQRFAAATAVASVMVALAATILLLSGAVDNSQSAYRITTAWCILSFVWGVWAMVAPRSWVPARLPAWGAVLGLILAVTALFILNLPAQFFGVQLSTAVRTVAIVVAVGVYYALWMAVRAMYHALAAR